MALCHGKIYSLLNYYRTESKLSYEVQPAEEKQTDSVQHVDDM